MAKCLVADDSKIIRMLFAKIMGNLGFDVTEAEDGEEVVEQCQLNEFDLVIMDYRLPVLDSRLEKQPKIIFCSSLLDIEKIEEALDGGADDYVLKPFDEEIIISKLSILGLV